MKDTEKLIRLIANKNGLSIASVRGTVALLESGATIPFIARYRKEATQSLDEVQIASISGQLKKIKDLIIRKSTIIKAITEQGKLTDGLMSKINNCWDDILLEDIYLPYKVKRKTRAEIARIKGLEPLAKLIMTQKNGHLPNEVKPYINDQVKNIEEAFSGARDIIAEWISENVLAREKIRRLFSRNATIQSKLIKKYKEEAEKYADYFDHVTPLKKCPSHRLLAMRRAEKEGYLKVQIKIDNDDAIEQLDRLFIKANNASAKQVKIALIDGYKRLLLPSIENEFKKSSKENADKEAISVFANNVNQLLLAAPAGSNTTLGIDPGFRTGCKVVVVDEFGDLLESQTIYPHPPQNQWLKSVNMLNDLLKKYDIKLAAIGNGTAGRETMSLVKEAFSSSPSVQVFSVNEAGASIYSASAVARKEFPNLDLTVRGAISIARRLMDPLAELVKIDPKSIGVGQYQHDVDQNLLQESLDEVVTLAVNKIGVNLNTASEHLLKYISGIGPKLAGNIVAYRSENRAFKNRKELKKVKGMGPKAFEQSAGFMRIPTSNQILDLTSVHPESYHIVDKIAKRIGVPANKLINNTEEIKRIKLEEFVNEQIGMPTLKDIVEALSQSGLDERGKAVVFNFQNDIKSIEDLHVGSIIPGIVSNLTKFGAFVDLGIKENGLIHVSQMADRFITDAAQVLSLDQKVRVEILSVDLTRKRIQLKMKGINQRM